MDMEKHAKTSGRRPPRYHIILNDSEATRDIVNVLQAPAPKRATLVRKLVLLGFEDWQREQEKNGVRHDHQN